MIYDNIVETIGNTPLVKLNHVASHIKGSVVAKVEYFNPGHSIKDRIAVSMVDAAEKSGQLKPGGTIIEGTSGNTGMGLALVAAVRGYRCIFTLADKQSPEKMDILRSVGAEVIVCPTNVEPDDPRSYYSVSKRLATEIPNSVYLNQYDNMSNTAAHIISTGPEIWEQTEGKITHFVSGMGTCGTISGVASYLKEKNPDIQVVGIDTYGSIFQKLHETGEIDTKEIYPYLTEGIGEDILPENCNMELIDRIVKVTDKDAALMARKLSRLEGLFVGWSCGSAVHGALEYARENLKKDDLMVVVLPDHGTRYLGKIYNDSWMKSHDYLDEGSMVTAAQILSQKASTPLITLDANQRLSDAVGVMRKHQVSQIPVMKDNQIVGSLNESRVLEALLEDPSMKEAAVSQLMSDGLPFVLGSTRLDAISKLINKDNPAVLVKLEDGSLDIISNYDLIQTLAL